MERRLCEGFELFTRPVHPLSHSRPPAKQTGQRTTRSEQSLHCLLRQVPGDKRSRLTIHFSLAVRLATVVQNIRAGGIAQHDRRGKGIASLSDGP